MPLDLKADVALLEQHRRAVAAQQCIAQPGLQSIPARSERAGHVTDVLVVHEQQRAESVRLHAFPRPLQAVCAQPVPVDALLPVQSYDPGICHGLLRTMSAADEKTDRRRMKPHGIEPLVKVSAEWRGPAREPRRPPEWRHPRSPPSVHGEYTRRQEGYLAARSVQ